LAKYSSEKKAKGYSKPKITGHLGGWRETWKKAER